MDTTTTRPLLTPLLALLALLGPLAAPGNAQEEEPRPPEEPREVQERSQPQEGDHLMAVIEAEAPLFARAVKQAGLARELERNGPYTVFAPTDEVFGPEVEGLLDRDPSEGPPDERLLRLVRAHIAPGEWTSEELRGARQIENVLGQRVALGGEVQEAERRTMGAEEPGEPRDPAAREATPGAAAEETGAPFLYGGARVVRADLTVSNGVLHLVDGVVQPETPESARPEAEEEPPPEPEATLPEASSRPEATRR